MADVAVLVVSCKKGECDKSGALSSSDLDCISEQLSIAKGQGLRHLLVVVNKMETSNFFQNRFDTIRQNLEPTVQQSGFLVANTQYIPVSGLTGINISKPTNLEWYQGKSLF